MDVQTVLPVLQMILAFGNICVLGYALMKFLNKPHDTLEDKVNTHDIKIRDIELALHQGNDRFREQDEEFKRQEETNSVLIHSILALIEFEIQYCLTEHKEMSKDLERARDDLHSYLARK